jgi:hypothetical protein
VADFVFNIAKGRVVELHTRVKLGDPSTSRLFVTPVDVAAVTDATIKDLDDMAAIVTAGVTRRTATGWTQKTVAAADLTAAAPTDASDLFAVDMVDLTWTAVTAGAVTDLILTYSSVTSPTTAQEVPLAQYDFAITPDGSDVVAQVNTAGYFSAS